MKFDDLKKAFYALEGDTAFFFLDLSDGETHEYNSEHSFDAASVIKLPVMATVFDSVYRKEFSLTDTLSVKEAEKVPSCGAVKYLPDGTMLPVSALVSMMITISDNTATNMLVRLVTMEKINAFLESQGLFTTRINRLIFDGEAAARGISNRIAISEIAVLLKKIYDGTLVCGEYSEVMSDILSEQQINHKIPNALPHVDIAHKTGEDSGESHDVAIVYGEHPYVLCFASEHTDVYKFEKTVREASSEIYEYMKVKYCK